ncbi:MAG: PilZ domain-containing protein [Gammaproteobacteria bacterium]|nr:PilZ domain-containing protein [Gammaproteobacteria bacterium]
MHPSIHNEQRLSFRHQVDIPVELLLSNGTALKVNACNLSINGILVSCDEWASNQIESRGIHNHPFDHIRINIVAELHNQNKLFANSRIIIARRMSQDNYLIGLEFIDFQNDSDASLQTYINSLEKKDT